MSREACQPDGICWRVPDVEAIISENQPWIFFRIADALFKKKLDLAIMVF